MDRDSEQLRSEIGRRLKALRVYRQIGQHDFAERLDVSVPTLRKFEGGHSSMTATQLVRAAQLLGVTSSVLTGETPFQAPEAVTQ